MKMIKTVFACAAMIAGVANAAAPYAEQGYWRVRQDKDGYWTFVDPRGNDVYLRGVEQVVWRGHSTRDGKKPPYRR